MKTLLVHLLLFTSVCAIAATQVTSPSSKSSKRSETLTVHREAFAQPFDHDKLTAYMNSLPKDGDYFVVEGDLLLTEQELRSYLVTNAQGEKPAAVSPELLVNTHNGDRDYYRDLAKRNLSYAVDRKTFTAQEYTLVLKNMGQAGKAWESACADCQIHFTHVPQADDDPQPEKVNFIVRKHDSKGEYIAASFFPHDDASRRNLNIDPAYFTTRADKVGVLRHEMGHILGYRHEHIRGISGCYFEDNFWQPLTPYDPKSVMHYFCGGGGSLQLELTALDRSGHRALYGGPSQAAHLTAALAEPDKEKRSETLTVHREAFAQPFDHDKLTAYMNSLPKDGDYFVVEGDLLLTEQELRSYLVTNAQGEKPAAVSPELLVNTHNGDRDYYRYLAKRNLSYAVDRKTFTAQEYTLVLKNMGQAGKAWESACADCQIHFTHVPQADDDPQPEKVNFIVRKHDSKGEYIAASFFPHDDASRRNLNIDPAYFTTRADKVGVLRHEMGHILGYRHEHIRGISGCYFEDNFWQPLTPYDPKSVMHYFCGGGGSLQLELTALDRSGHRALYGGPSQAAHLTAALAEPDKEKRSETLTVHREAFAQPFDHDKLTAYMNSLPKDGDYFVVEGDLLLTEQELRSYLVTNAQGEKPAAVSPELLVNTHNGDRDYYRDLAKRNLSYAVDRKTFTAQEYTLVLKNMGQAGKAWESACADCQIHFTHVPQADDDPQPEKVNFIVRKHDSKGEYIAASFFPHDDASRRNLNIDPSYFTTRADKVGVLRHEMGHILGYRHEHIRGISGCYFEDNFWQPLTPYDPKSVMHYFCGGGGSLQLELTALDRSGHRALYGG